MIESEIHDLYEFLVLNDGMADHDTYHTIVGIANDVAELEDKNANLRELADAVKEFVEDTHCEDCPCRRDCDDNNRIFCANNFSYHAFAAMRDLGIEVDG